MGGLIQLSARSFIMRAASTVAQHQAELLPG
jgi:hypothetical protein